MNQPLASQLKGSLDLGLMFLVELDLLALFYIGLTACTGGNRLADETRKDHHC